MQKAIARMLVVLTCFSSLSVGALAADVDETVDVAYIEEETLAGEQELIDDSLDVSGAEIVLPEVTETEDIVDEDALLENEDSTVEDIDDQDTQAEENASNENDIQDEVVDADAQVEGTDDSATQDTDNSASGEITVDADALLAAPVVKIDFTNMKNGWHYVSGNYYYVTSGSAYTGWLYNAKSWYYLDPTNGGAMATGLTTINGDGTYYMNASGAMKTGWVYDSGWYYFGSSGRMTTGWLKSSSKWYYLDPENDGLMATGLTTIDGDGTYYMNASGAMKTGWVYDSGWYYFGSSGRMTTGWLKSNSKWYYLDPENDGLMATGLTTINGDGTYYMNASGAMKTGWVSIGGKWYYFGSSGRMTTGWMKTGSVWTTKWYYLDPDNGGAMTTGWLETGDTTYYLDKSTGVMKTGWMQSGSDWYFFGVTGKMMTGWIYSGGYDYYLYSKNDDVSSSKIGTMATSTVIDDREIDASGHAELPAVADGSSAKDIIVARAQYYSSDTNNLMLMDRSSSKLYIFEGSTNNWTLTRTWSIAAGYKTTPTPSGTYVVQDKGYYFDSGTARCFWWTQFYGSYCFHSILYYQNGTSTSTASVMNASLGSNISHGCVRLATSNAYWVYSNIAYGTGVVVY